MAESFLHIIEQAKLPSDGTIGFVTQLKAEESGIEGILMLFLEEGSVDVLLECIDKMLGG